jgi:serine/threonine protein phosphatase 1
MNKQCWVVGDVHGCGQTLQILLGRLSLSEGDKVIFLGDIIDRGTSHKLVFESIDTLEAQNIQVVLIRGNHEQAMLDALAEENSRPKRKGLFMKTYYQNSETWIKYGGESMLKEYDVKYPWELPKNIIERIQKSVLYVSTENYLLVHAGFNFEIEDIYSDTHAMLWLREFSPDLNKTNNRRVIHGHVPVGLDLIRQCIQKPEYGFIALDNGCYMKNINGMGNLVAMELNTGNLVVQSNLERV